MAELAGFGMAAQSFTTAHSEAEGIKSEGKYQQKMSELNAKMAEFQAEDAIRRGDKEANVVRRQTKKVMGSQRAAAAASGIDVNDAGGSVGDIQSETNLSGEIDQITIRGNAWREAFGYRSQALQDRTQGEFYKLAAKNKARNTLLTGGMNAITSGVSTYSGLKK